jgi:hypothetical protein
MTFVRFLNYYYYYYCYYYVFCFCTVSPAGAVAGVTTAPAPVGNSQPTALARRRGSRNCFSPIHPFTPQHSSTVLVVASSGQILHFTFKSLTFLRQAGKNFWATLHSLICFESVCVCVCARVCACVLGGEHRGSSHKDYFVVYIACTVHLI